jgi:hypothetical protein
MSTHDEESRAPEQSADDAGPDTDLDQPADPFEPEAPAHLDPDPETAAHHAGADEGSAVDGADPAPPQPS